MKYELVDQKKLDPRKIWGLEDKDFTPWLAEHLDGLGERLGMNLELVNTEVSVGAYFVDVLAKDVDTNKFVIIENQLEKTNHDHLGKCIVYAAGLDAETIIWIAKEFTEEHKKAIDWLNDNTADNLAFYAVQLETWEVSKGKAMLHYNIVCSPSADIKKLKQTSTSVSDSAQRQLQFWTAFKDKLKAYPQIKSSQTPRPQYWYDIALGKSGINMSNCCSVQKNYVGVRIYISNKVVQDLYPYLESKKEDIEKDLGFKLNWNPNPESKDKTIIYPHEFNLEDEASFNEAVDWMVKNTVPVWTVFSKILKGKK